MKKMILAAAFMLLVGLFGGQVALAQSADTGFAGKVVRWNGDPVAGATVAILAGPLENAQEYGHTTSTADGSWSITVPAGGPYWVHIRTFGTWWGYSYQTPFTLRAGERIAQIYFAVGPREVHEITLPTPVSNIAPATATASPATPVSNVQPAIGPGEQTTPTPVSNVKPEIVVPGGQQPAGLPQTGASQRGMNFKDDLPAIAFLVAALVLAAGIGIVRASRRGRAVEPVAEDVPETR